MGRGVRLFSVKPSYPDDIISDVKIHHETKEEGLGTKTQYGYGTGANISGSNQTEIKHEFQCYKTCSCLIAPSNIHCSERQRTHAAGDSVQKGQDVESETLNN